MNYLKNLKEYLQIINDIIQNSKLENLEILFDTLNSHFENKSRLFLAGNGGSASIASHATTDIKKIRKNKNTINAICLNENISSITALSNDEGYENYLVNQIINFEVDENDSLIVISSSGNSDNVINLVNYCKEKNAKTFALIGFDGGKLNSTADFPILLNSKRHYYGPVEDAHMMIFHLFAHLVKNDLDELS